MRRRRRPREWLLDELAEAVSGLRRRSGRSALTAMGVLVGVTALVMTLGLASSAAAQISFQFDRLRATEVQVGVAGSTGGSGVLPPDSDDRLGRLNGVITGGISWQVPGLGIDGAPDRSSAGSVPVVAASPGYLAAAGAATRSGALFNRFHDERQERVAVLGAAAARSLGIESVAAWPTLALGPVRFTVIGIVDRAERDPALVLDMIIPAATAADIVGDRAAERGLVVVRPGAAELVARQVPLALRPDRPELVTTIAPPDARGLRGHIESDTTTLYLLLAAVTLLVSAFGIANTTVVAVLERVGEIGLRRAIGATRTQIGAQFLVESGALGALGGTAGTLVGVVGVVTAAHLRGWTPVLDPAVLALGPALGLVIGVLAGLHPALKASRIQPIEALRS